MLVNRNNPTPPGFVSVDCEGVEIICFDRLLQVLILRELLINDNRDKTRSQPSLKGWDAVRPGRI
jgi:hypothetical protein